LFQGRRTEAEMDEELRFHIAEQADLNIAAGQSPEDALRAARIQFGGLEQQKEC
jgi:putative ABC transport system permease protein